ncbi:riboflavin synthase [Rhodovulum sp. MB263]|uniref:riboflavin synthase n=1 Tax=Rhodovulum sp. (strain MB263) TaxID=308754 RepID=UPI0009B7E17E|nr:riboflavin synthase [Rhodovulum sp. MB263]ARC89509.1 riboflavin synthase [Rhodovulum sp. MB263]
MFTGIITDIGTVRALTMKGDLTARIDCAYAADSIDIGASIACNGVCLTVTDRGPAGEGAWFAVSISAETVSKTNIGGWAEGTRINLERALRVGDELGGHIVSGHVDGVAELVAMAGEGDSTRMSFEAPEALARFIAPKGSVALNGISLTVNEVEGLRFGINVIPHTSEATTLGLAQVGDRINLEIDTMARYVARLREYDAA